ncbi:MAG: rhomboid family intramembrane serine protease [Tetrasphaera sp.]
MSSSAYRRVAAPREGTRSRGVIASAAIGSTAFVAVLWLSEFVDTLVGNRLDGLGIRPRTEDGLVGILWAPLLHGGWGHLLANSLPVLVLGFIILCTGLQRWLLVTAIVWLLGGLGTWLTGGGGSIHIGASGLVFGWFTYVISVGFFTRRTGQIALGITLFLVYGGMLWGVLPGRPGTSWQGHLFGALAGILAAWLVGRREPRQAWIR